MNKFCQCYYTNNETRVFIYQGNCPRLSTVSDKNNWKAVMTALSVIGFTEEEVQVGCNLLCDWLSVITHVVVLHLCLHLSEKIYSWFFLDCPANVPFCEMLWYNPILFLLMLVVTVHKNLFISNKFYQQLFLSKTPRAFLCLLFHSFLNIMSIIWPFDVCSPKSQNCFPCIWPQSLLNSIASILHLGNAQFGEGEEGETYITTEPQINNLAKVRTDLLVFPDVQICGPRLRTDVLLLCSCWLLMAVLSGRH